jgi:O-antigen/teichoic acid export membrane protein
LSIATAILFIVIAFGSGDRETFMLFLAGAPIILLLSTSSLRQAVTRGLGRPLLGQVCELVARPGVQLIGLGVLASGLVTLRPTPLAAMIIFLVAIATSAILAFLLQAPLMPRLPVGERPLLPPRSEWLGPFFRTAVVGWAQAINLQIGTIVLGAMSGDAEVANFRIAQQLATLLAFGLTVVTALYANEFSRLFVRGEIRTLERLAAKGAIIGGATALAIGLLFLLGGQWLIDRLFGEGFSAAFVPLAVMILGQLVNALFGPVGAVAIATKNEKSAMTVHLVSVAVNVLLCALLVPVWGAVGAAAGAAFSLALWNIILFYVIRRRLGISAYAGAYFHRD